MDFLKEGSHKDFCIATPGKTRANFIPFSSCLTSQLCTSFFSPHLLHLLDEGSLITQFSRICTHSWNLFSLSAPLVHSLFILGITAPISLPFGGDGALCYTWLTDMLSLTSKRLFKIELESYKWRYTFTQTLTIVYHQPCSLIW